MRGIKAQSRLGGGNLVDVDAADTVLVEQPKHDVPDPVLPQGRSRTHDCQRDAVAVGLFAAIAFGARLAVFVLRRGGQSRLCELPILGALVARVPQPAVDVGHRVNAGGLQFRDALSEVLLDREVVGIVVVEGNLVPVVPVKAGRQAARLGELSDLRNAVGCSASRHDPGGQLSHPFGGVLAAIGSKRRPPSSFPHRPGAVDLRCVEPVASQKLPTGVAGQVEADAGLAHVGRWMVEREEDHLFSGLTFREDGFRRAERIVHAHIKPGPFRPVVGSHVLHGRPTAGVGPAPLAAFAPHLRKLDAGGDLCEHPAAFAQVAHRRLREYDVPQSPSGTVVRDVQVPRQRAVVSLDIERHFDTDSFEALIHRGSKSKRMHSGDAAGCHIDLPPAGVGGDGEQVLRLHVAQDDGEQRRRLGRTQLLVRDQIGEPDNAQALFLLLQDQPQVPRSYRSLRRDRRRNGGRRDADPACDEAVPRGKDQKGGGQKSCARVHPFTHLNSSR